MIGFSLVNAKSVLWVGSKYREKASKDLKKRENKNKTKKEHKEDEKRKKGNIK